MKSTKLISIGVSYFTIFSIIYLSVKVCSQHYRIKRIIIIIFIVIIVIVIVIIIVIVIVLYFIFYLMP